MYDAVARGDLAAMNERLEEAPGLLDKHLCHSEEGAGHGGWEADTPLGMAAERGHDALVARLLALGADAEVRDGYGRVPMHLACQQDRAGALALLLGGGTDVNIGEAFNRPPLHYAVGSTKCTACAKLLLTRCRGTLNVDGGGWGELTPLDAAAHRGQAELVALLLEAGADPTLRPCTVPDEFEEPLLCRNRNVREPCLQIVTRATFAPDCVRVLFRARSLLDADRTVQAVSQSLAAKGLPPDMQEAVLALAPPGPVFIKGRVAVEKALPRVSVVGEDEGLVGVVRCVVGLDGDVGLSPDLMVELLEMMTPKWDPARKGEVLGAYYEKVEAED